MKVSFILVICFALIFGILAGCTETSIGRTSFADPVIGSWKSIQPAYQDYYYTMSFFENGKGMKGTIGGTWEKYDETHYAFTYNSVDAYAGAYIATIGFVYDPKLDTLTYGNDIYQRVNTQTIVPITPTYTSSLSVSKNVATSNKISDGVWIWSRDNWEGWQYIASWSGRELGSNSEFGPVMIGDHGEYGTDTQLKGGSTQSSVWRTFNDPSGIGWNTIEFTGMLTATDTPLKRWMTIDVNDQQVFKGSATQNPPGNGVKFIIKRSFIQSPSVKVKISNGQDSAFGGRFSMYYYSVKLSREN